MSVGTNSGYVIVQGIGSGIGTAFLGYITVAVRKAGRKFMLEHKNLIQQTKDNTEAIKENQEDIKRILIVIEDMQDVGRNGRKRYRERR